MKKILLLVVVALINFVSAKFDPIATPGCEKAAEFRNITLKSCCETYPSLHDPQIMKECESTCKSVASHIENLCCLEKCDNTAIRILNSKGEFDSDALNSYIMTKLFKNEAWTERVKKTIDDCVKEGENAPEIFAKWKKECSNVKKCEQVLIIAIKNCMARNLFFNCPLKISSEKCKELEEFGKSCPYFPYEENMINY